jgi:hypothetical protein
MPRLARTNTDKIGADKLYRIIKTQVLSGDHTAEGDTGLTGSFFHLPAAEETKHPGEEPDS